MNLLCGVLATACAFDGLLFAAALLIFAGAIFDFFDGFVARALKVSSEMGKELDSLADNISFGLAPAAMFSAYVRWWLTGSFTAPLATLECGQVALVCAPLVLGVFAGLRLAKFNIDTRQTENFLGLTTTATGLFTASLFTMMDGNESIFRDVLTPTAVVVMVAVFCALLVSEVPMFSLKVKHWTLKGNELRLLLVAVAIVSIIVLGLGGIAATIALYVIFSIVKWLAGMRS